VTRRWISLTEVLPPGRLRVFAIEAARIQSVHQTAPGAVIQYSERDGTVRTVHVAESKTEVEASLPHLHKLRLQIST
jgi:hypothetical protein